MTAPEERGAALPRALAMSVRAASGLAALTLSGLMLVVAGSILARLAYDLSSGAIDLLIPGAIELARYALLLMVFLALPGALGGGLVRVDLLAERLPGGLGSSLDRAWALLAGAFATVLAWRLGAAAWLQAGRGDTTQDLGLPLWPFTGAAALCALLGVGVALARALERRG